MAHSNTVLAQLLNVIPRHQFQKTVDQYQADKRTRTLSCWGQFVALLVGQLSGASSLRVYKQRWQIELFFKWIKQNLKIKQFYGTSENAVKLQVLVAMISYVLLRLIQQGVAPERRLGNVSIRLGSVLMQRMPLLEVFRKPPDLPDDTGQLGLGFG